MIQKINMPGIENTNVKIKTNRNVPGRSLNSFVKSESQVPLIIAFNKADTTQMEIQANIDLKNLF